MSAVPTESAPVVPLPVELVEPERVDVIQAAASVAVEQLLTKSDHDESLDIYAGSALRVGFGGLRRVTDKVFSPYHRFRAKARSHVDSMTLNSDDAIHWR